MTRQILITTGDADGIGLEVTLKALVSLASQMDVIYFVFLAPEFVETAQAKLQSHYAVEVFPDFKSASGITWGVALIADSSKSPPEWVEEAAEITKAGRAHAMVTAPLSKPLIQENLKKLRVARLGVPIRGHTEILQLVDGTQDIHMVFLGSEFNVFLGTAHVPLREVPELVARPEVLEENFRRARELQLFLKSSKPIGVLGLNPHAGEGGLLGKDESPIEKMIEHHAPHFVGPLPPDSAFIENERRKYCFYLCWYHDQGLIPFKTVHEFRSGVHISWGLSFLRTSVDHGTAKNIFGKNIADPHSMREAIEFAIRQT